MRVLQLISSGGCYGAEMMLVNLAAGLENLGCRTLIGVFRNAHRPHIEIAEYAANRGLRVEIIPCGGKADAKAVRIIREQARQHRAELVHTHGYKADIYGYAAMRRSGTPVMATCHNWTGETPPLVAYGIVDRLILRWFQGIAAVSAGVSGSLKKAGISARKIRVIHNGIDVARFAEARPTYAEEIGKGSRVTVGMVGRLVPEKGPQYLIQAAARVLKSFPETQFVFVGDGPARPNLEKMAQSCGIASRVIFAGQREDMPGIYSSFDVFVLPSLREAMPMSVMEAMAAGKPVIATRVGAIPDMVEHGRTGLIVQPGNALELEESLSLLISNGRLRQEMGSQAGAWAAERFSSEAMARVYLEFYEELIACRRSPTLS